ncbi:GNAT family N-acetyltransferase [Parvularcula dongshanensis]|uniref:Phosphinothricin acetyltransferase n=1 Tax=Parvularcula dongshanensis TaxID=1173995 RepID=A0A840I3U7_9PROT|nr:GNAT family N-acetyltransferase [Parvularcula dongshanensis]MBB4658982.1 phosphinothricin acetyltransferase [Parvularcula dongshanensis]
MTLRDAKPSDLAAITAIYGASVEAETASWETLPPDEAEMGRRLGQITAGGYPYLVAAEGEAVLGFAYAGPFRLRAAYDWSVEDSIYVAKDARGRGVGTALLGALVERCEARGFRQMLAVLGEAEGGSRKLHAACGFTEAGRIKDFGWKLGAWRDLLLMQRSLGPGGATPPEELTRP